MERVGGPVQAGVPPCRTSQSAALRIGPQGEKPSPLFLKTRQNPCASARRGKAARRTRLLRNGKPFGPMAGPSPVTRRFGGGQQVYSSALGFFPVLLPQCLCTVSLLFGTFLKRLCYRKRLMLFSLKLQRDNRQNVLAVVPAKGKTGKEAVCSTILWK